MKSSLRWVSWSEWQELLKDWVYWKQLTQNCDVVVRLRFQSRDTSVSLFSLKVVRRLKEFRKCGEFRSYFFYIMYCIAADSNILRLNIAWHALRIWSQRNFTKSVKSISLELPPLYKFPQAHDSFLTPPFLLYLTSKLPANPVSFRMKIYSELYNFWPSPCLPSGSKSQSSLSCIIIIAS